MLENNQAHSVVSFFDGNNRVTLEGAAFNADGLTARSLSVSYRMRELFNGFVEKELASAKSGCPQDEGCGIRVLRSLDDGGDISAATFHCPKAEQLCGELATKAAANTIAKADKATANISQIVEQQFDSVAGVSIVFLR
jgi:hypothetical protein